MSDDWTVELADDHVDSLGRRQFTALWEDDGPHAQVFFMNVDDYITRSVAKGRNVSVVNAHH